MNIRRAGALALVAAGAVRFTFSAVMPATRALTGDFATAFPNPYFAHLRPDFSTVQVLPGWTYGPMMHIVTLPLFLVPAWRMVPAVWAAVNLAAVIASFVCVLRLSEDAESASWTTVAVAAGLWLLFQPLVTCFVMGNIEIVEMAMLLAGLAALHRGREIRSGLWLGVATMIKFLPIGFVGWLVLRRQWRAAASAGAVIAVIALAAAVTVGWASNVTFRLATEPPPLSGLHELSVTSLFLHRAGVLDSEAGAVRWFPPARFDVAKRAGQLASGLIAAGFAAVVFARRRQPATSLELSVMFMAMFMLLPWNHDHYYIFSLLPITVLLFRAVRRRDRGLLVLTIASYVLMSPPLPFSWIDRARWFGIPFAYVLNYQGVPIAGALLLWAAATRELFSRPEATADAPRPAGGGLRRLAAASALLVVPMFCGVAYFDAAAPARDAGVYVETDGGVKANGMYAMTLLPPGPGNAIAAAIERAPLVAANKVLRIFVVGPSNAEPVSAAESAQLIGFTSEAIDVSDTPESAPVATAGRRVNLEAYRISPSQPAWTPGGGLFDFYEYIRSRESGVPRTSLIGVVFNGAAGGAPRLYAARIGPPE
jgi:hypothetical protein